MDKCCNKCKLIKNTDDFYISKAAKDGKQGACKPCSVLNAKVAWNKIKKGTRPGKTPEEKKLAKKIADRKWRVKNPDKARARSRRYDKRIELATPKWLTIEQLNQIDEIYKNKPEGFHVDHIIPLRGKNISGLHVPENLQYLKAEENLKKKNKFTL